MTDEDDRLRASCRRHLRGHGPVRPAALGALLTDVVEPDHYGAGGVVADLEREVADLLGLPAALFLPSGTMAQQAVLRVHADRRRRRTVAFHPTCHLDLHEGRAAVRLHGLVGRPVGDARALLRAEDLHDVAEPLAALLLELPQRELGARLPDWDDLVAQTEWARAQGAAVHLDGARLWECGPHYGRALAEIAGLFDTVYVSFYKGLGGVGGCCLAGPDDVIAEVREWRRRHGGTLFGLWPYAASGLAVLRERLPLMPAYAEHARALAAALGALADVEVVPDPPVTPMFHLHLRVEPEAFRAAALRLAAERGVWTWPRSDRTDSPRWQRVELPVGDATLGFGPAEVVDLVRTLQSGD